MARSSTFSARTRDMPKTFLTLIFDPELERNVRELREVLASAGIYRDPVDRHRPHITIDGLEIAEPHSMGERLREVCSRYAPLPIRLHHIGLFPERSVLFLEPPITRSLLELHRSVVEDVDQAMGCAQTSPNFVVDNWKPHCTLIDSVPTGMLGQAVELVKEHWRVLEGHAVGIGVLVPPATVDEMQFPFKRPASTN
jgi:2'-5' RNA ligase